METPQIDVVRAQPPGPQIRATGDGDGSTLAGHFSVFDTMYEVNSIFEGHFMERIAPGAFRETMAADRDAVKVTFNHGHDPTMGDQVLGEITDMREDSTGAAYEVDLFRGVPDLIVDGLRAGAYGSSFRFRVTADEWDDEPGASDVNPHGIPERTITKVRLFEFGPVTFPANPEATAGLRSMTDEWVDQLRDREPSKFEAVCRAAGREQIPTGQSSPASGDGGGSDDRTAGAPTASPPDTTQPSSSRKDPTMSETTFMSVDERAARQDEIRARLEEIDADHAGGTLPEDIQSEWDRLSEEFETHEAAVRSDAERKERLQRIGNAQPTSNTRGSDPGVPMQTRSRNDQDVYDLTAIRRSVSSVDELPAAYRSNAMRAIERGSFPGAPSREDAQSQASKLLDSVDTDDAQLAHRMLATGSPVYHRAFGKVVMSQSTVGLNSEEQRALSVGTNSAGGFAVPFDLDPTVILTSDGSINPLRSVSRVVQTVSKEWQGITSSGITVSRSGEASEADDDSPSIAQPTVTPTRVDGFVPFSMEVEQDWGQLVSEMTMLLNDAKEQEEASSFVTGDGTGNNPNGVVATLAGSSQVSQSGSAGEFTIPDDIFALEEALPPRFRARARFMANKAIYNQVRGASTGSDGGDLWVRLGAAQPSELIGYPAHELSTMDGTIEATGAGDNLILLMGDFNQFLIVDRVGMSVELIPNLFGGSNRPTGQRGIFAVWRNSSLILVDNAFRLLNVVSAT